MIPIIVNIKYKCRCYKIYEQYTTYYLRAYNTVNYGISEFGSFEYVAVHEFYVLGFLKSRLKREENTTRMRDCREEAASARVVDTAYDVVEISHS